jgi:hypothetical protein
MILGGDSGLFEMKRKDGTILDISGFFDGFHYLQPELNESLRKELAEWFQMPLEGIIESSLFSSLTIGMQIEVLNHMKHDHRFSGNTTLFENEIEKLKQVEELQIQKEIYQECFQHALNSRQEGLAFVKDWITDTEKDLIVSKTHSHLSFYLDKKLLSSRLDLLLQIQSWIKDASYFDDSTEYLEVDKTKEKSNSEIEDLNFPADPAINKKMMILNSLGIIDYLESYIRKNGKYSDVKLYTLISWISGIEKVGSIRNLMPSMRNHEHQSKNNPYKNEDLKTDVERMIFNFNNTK